MDQVPAGLYDPKFTYSDKGATRVHIASNGSADSHRFCTLQVCVRNVSDPSLPRNGQPKLCMCFRGTGARISDLEKQGYHPDVTVMWQPKAWYDNLTCNKWVALYAIAEIKKADLGVGQRHLILCDNLAGALALAHALTDCPCCQVKQEGATRLSQSYLINTAEQMSSTSSQVRNRVRLRVSLVSTRVVACGLVSSRVVSSRVVSCRLVSSRVVSCRLV